MKNEYSERLNNAIRSTGFTQQQLSDKTGIPQANISRYLTRSLKKWPFDYAMTVCKALNINPAEILTGENPSGRIKLPVFSEIPPSQLREFAQAIVQELIRRAKV